MCCCLFLLFDGSSMQPLIAVGVVFAGEMHLSTYRLHSLVPVVLVVTTFVVRSGMGEKLGMPLSSVAGLMRVLRCLLPF